MCSGVIITVLYALAEPTMVSVHPSPVFLTVCHIRSRAAMWCAATALDHSAVDGSVEVVQCLCKPVLVQWQPVPALIYLYTELLEGFRCTTTEARAQGT